MVVLLVVVLLVVLLVVQKRCGRVRVEDLTLALALAPASALA